MGFFFVRVTRYIIILIVELLVVFLFFVGNCGRSILLSTSSIGRYILLFISNSGRNNVLMLMALGSCSQCSSSCLYMVDLSRDFIVYWLIGSKMTTRFSSL